MKTQNTGNQFVSLSIAFQEVNVALTELVNPDMTPTAKFWSFWKDDSNGFANKRNFKMFGLGLSKVGTKWIVSGVVA